MGLVLEWVNSAEKLIGFIVLLFGLSGGVFAWVQKRGQRMVGKQVAPLKTGQQNQAARLQKVEQRLDRVDDHLSALEERTGHIEHSLPGLATKQDLSDLRVNMAELRATVIGVGNKVDTLYRAALSASHRGEE